MKVDNPASFWSTSILVLCLWLSAFAWGHLGHRHTPSQPLSQTEKQKMKASSINKNYLRSVKPIFQRSCFDCHSSQTRFPWYYDIPGAKQLIDRDISESKKHLDLTGDYPFKGHGSPEEDLKAIYEVISNESMPPFRYRILHPGSAPSADEKIEILDWIGKSQEVLSETH